MFGKILFAFLLELYTFIFNIGVIVWYFFFEKLHNKHKLGEREFHFPAIKLLRVNTPMGNILELIEVLGNEHVIIWHIVYFRFR